MGNERFVYALQRFSPRFEGSSKSLNNICFELSALFQFDYSIEVPFTRDQEPWDDIEVLPLRVGELAFDFVSILRPDETLAFPFFGQG